MEEVVKSIGCTVNSDGVGVGSAGVLILESEDDDEKEECCRRCLLRMLLKKVE